MPVMPVIRNRSWTRVAEVCRPSDRLNHNTVADGARNPLFHLLLLAVSLTLMPISTLAEDIAVQAEQLQKLREHIHEITSDVESMRGQHTATQDALEKTEKEIGKCRRRAASA